MKNIVEMKKNIFALLLLLLPLAAFCQDGSLRLKDKFSLKDTVRIEEIADTSYVIWNKNEATCYNKEDAAIFKFCELKMKKIEPLCNFTIQPDSVWGTVKKGQQQSDTLLDIRHFFLKDSIPHANNNDTLMLVVDKANSVRVFSVGKKPPFHAENKPLWLVWALAGLCLAAIIIVIMRVSWSRFLQKKPKQKKLPKPKKFTVKLTTNISHFKNSATAALGENNYKIGKKNDKIKFTVSKENANNINDKKFIETLKKASMDNQSKKHDQTVDKAETYLNKLLDAINTENTTDQTSTTILENGNGTGEFSPTHSGNKEKDEISQLNQKLEEYKKLIKEFQKKDTSDNAEPSEGATNHSNQNYVTTLHEAHDFLEKLIAEKKSVKKLEEENKSLTVENSNLSTTIQNVQTNPKSFKDKSDYNKLTELINKAEKCEDICNHPDNIDENTAVGKLIKKAKRFTEVLDNPEKLSTIREAGEDKLSDFVRKSLLLDKVKNNPDLIASNKEFDRTELRDRINLIDKPETILNGNKLSSKNLYRLISDIKNIGEAEAYDSSRIQYTWIKSTLAKTVENSNQYVHIQKVASSFGINTELSALTGQVQTVFQYAKSYLQFADYKNYWKNLQSPLLTALKQLPSRNETDNMRVLLFYVSQLYSMTCIMGKIYGDLTQTTSNHVVNVKVFNSNSSPNLGSLGFPSTTEASFKDFTFQYLNEPGEVEMINYLKKYKPLPFIFLNSYYDNSVLS